MHRWLRLIDGDPKKWAALCNAFSCIAEYNAASAIRPATICGQYAARAFPAYICRGCVDLAISQSGAAAVCCQPLSRSLVSSLLVPSVRETWQCRRDVTVGCRQLLPTAELTTSRSRRRFRTCLLREGARDRPECPIPSKLRFSQAPKGAMSTLRPHLGRQVLFQCHPKADISSGHFFRGRGGATR